jgi:tetratricopeptide (TPR) repeat protein
MILIPMLAPNGKVSLLIILEDDNIERIKQYDQAEVHWEQLSAIAHMRPATIGIGYATAEEAAKLGNFARQGKFREAIQLVTRGFKYHPELGDHDFGPVSLTKKEN